MATNHFIDTGNLAQVLFKSRKGSFSNALQRTFQGNNKHLVFKSRNLLAWYFGSLEFWSYQSLSNVGWERIWQWRLKLFAFPSGHLKYHFESRDWINLSTLTTVTESKDIHSEYVSQHNSFSRTACFLNVWTKLQKKEDGLPFVSIIYLPCSSAVKSLETQHC